MKTLKDVMPKDAFDIDDVFKLRDIEVIKEYYNNELNWIRWPGTHKNVNYWCVLANGKAVGWNENIAIGWSFPIISYNGKIE